MKKSKEEGAEESRKRQERKQRAGRSRRDDDEGTTNAAAPRGGRSLYLVELLVSPELEEFGRRVELVGRPDQKRQCGNLGSVFGTLCKI